MSSFENDTLPYTKIPPWPSLQYNGAVNLEDIKNGGSQKEHQLGKCVAENNATNTRLVIVKSIVQTVWTHSTFKDETKFFQYKEWAQSRTVI